MDSIAANMASAAMTCDDFHLPLSCFRSGAVAFLYCYCYTSYRTYDGGDSSISSNAKKGTREYAI